MPNFTIYINNDNEDNFKNELKKSALVNILLGEYYASKPGAVKKAVTAGKIIKIPGKIYKLPTDVDSGTETQPFEEICSGHAMRWNCGRKGCKYAS